MNYCKDCARHIYRVHQKDIWDDDLTKNHWCITQTIEHIASGIDYVTGKKIPAVTEKRTNYERCDYIRTGSQANREHCDKFVAIKGGLDALS